MGQTDKYAEQTETANPAPGNDSGATEAQTPDTPGNDENGDGLTGGQTTADNTGDILGV